jgi:50S ribosomal subunit-associated GTPase HflX
MALNFKATLQETRQASLLLHVIDAADLRVNDNIDAVNEVLAKSYCATSPAKRSDSACHSSGKPAPLCADSHTRVGRSRQASLLLHVIDAADLRVNDNIDAVNEVLAEIEAPLHRLSARTAPATAAANRHRSAPTATRASAGSLRPLLLHVIDAADLRVNDNIDAVNEVLAEIEADEIPASGGRRKSYCATSPAKRSDSACHSSGKPAPLCAVDMLDGFEPRIDRDEENRPTRVWLSAQSGAGLPLLWQALSAATPDGFPAGWL